MALSPEKQAELDELNAIARGEGAPSADALPAAPPAASPSTAVAPASPPADPQAGPAAQVAPTAAAASDRDFMASMSVPTAGASFAPGVTSLQTGVDVTGNMHHERLPDWIHLPELQHLSAASAKAVLGTLASGPEDTKKILEKQFPNMEIKQDGRYLLMKSEDGNTYAWKPGLRPSDLARGGGAALATIPATIAGPFVAGPGIAGAALSAGLAATMLGSAREKAGGSALTAGEVLGNAAGGGLLHGAGSAAGAVGRLLTGEAAPAAEAAAQVANPKFDELAGQVGAASRGDAAAKAQAVASINPNQGVIDAAERIGARDLLRPEHVTDSPVVREVAQSARAADQGLREITDENTRSFVEHVRGMFSDWGAELQRGASSASTRDRLTAGLTALRGKTVQAFKVVEKAMPGEADAVAPGAIKYIEERAAAARGLESLSEQEQSVLAKLKGNLSVKGAEIIREDLRDAAKGAGPLAGINRGIAKKLDGILGDDALVTAEQYGQRENLMAARELSKQENTLKSGVKSLFGKQLEKTIDGSMATRMGGAIKSASSGDTSKLLKIWKSVPPSMRGETVLDSFGQVLEKTGDIKTFVSLSDAVEADPQLRNLLMTSMNPADRSGFMDAVNVARRFALADAAPASPGRLRVAVSDAKASGVFAKLSDMAVSAVDKGLSFAPGGGFVKLIAGKVLGGESDRAKLVGQFLAKESPALVEAAVSGAQMNAQRLSMLAQRPLFTRVMDAAGVPRALREKWLESALRVGSNMGAQSGQSSTEEK